MWLLNAIVVGTSVVFRIGRFFCPETVEVRSLAETLVSKNDDISNFVSSLRDSQQGLEVVNSAAALAALRTEFDSLRCTLARVQERLESRIRREQSVRMHELQTQVSVCTAATQGTRALLAATSQALGSSDCAQLAEASAAFRVPLVRTVAQDLRHFVVDLSQEKALLEQLTFLPVPRAPEFVSSRCRLADNAAALCWAMPPAPGTWPPSSTSSSTSSWTSPTSSSSSSSSSWTSAPSPWSPEKVSHYEVEYCRSDSAVPPPAETQRWTPTPPVSDTQHRLAGLELEGAYVSFRVRACNKALRGPCSLPLTLETHAFVFAVDGASSHPNVRVAGLALEWDALGGAVARAAGETRTEAGTPRGASSPGATRRARAHSASTPPPSPKGSPVRAPPGSPGWKAASGSCRPPSPRSAHRGRFTGESYTALGNVAIARGQAYWEATVSAGSRAVAVGVAYRSLGRFEALGRTAASWCLHWAAGPRVHSLAVKHDNRARAIVVVARSAGLAAGGEAGGATPSLPALAHRGTLSFYDPEAMQTLYTFRTKFSQPLHPAFSVSSGGSVWCGGLTVRVGLQVPSALRARQGAPHSARSHSEGEGSVSGGGSGDRLPSP
ncbi:fibronectin type III and SPRY domain-containing protein 1-like [Lampetra fluviatilis]